jgi:hypothetical protein
VLFPWSSVTRGMICLLHQDARFSGIGNHFRRSSFWYYGPYSTAIAEKVTEKFSAAVG